MMHKTVRTDEEVIESDLFGSLRNIGRAMGLGKALKNKAWLPEEISSHIPDTFCILCQTQIRLEGHRHVNELRLKRLGGATIRGIR